MWCAPVRYETTVQATPFWNPNGDAWTGMFKTEVTVTKETPVAV
jgi:hypothetical protein